MITSDVISQLDMLGVDNNYTRRLIGPEQKYIGSLLNSGVNNLEENLKIGQNEIITREYCSDNNENYYKELIEFRSESITDKYYYIEYYEYNTEPTGIVDGRVAGTKLTLDAHNDIGNYSSQSVIIQKYKLYFKNGNNSELISVKTISRRIRNSNGFYTEVISHTDN